MRLSLFDVNTANPCRLMERLTFYGQFSGPVDSCDNCGRGFGYTVMVADGVGGDVDVDVFFVLVS